MNKHFFSLSSLALLCLVLPSAASAATLAPTWQGPSDAPPGGNAFPPINVSEVPQYKEGGLSLGSTDTSNLTSTISLFAPISKFLTIFGKTLTLTGDGAKYSIDATAPIIIRPNADPNQGFTPLTVQARRNNRIYIMVQNLNATGVAPYAIFADNVGRFGVSQLGTGAPTRLSFDNNRSLTIYDSLTLSQLAGSGNRMVVANPSGTLSAQAIPSGGGSSLPNGTKIGQILMWDTSTNAWVLAPSAECKNNEILKWDRSAGNDGAWECATDKDTTSAVGDGGITSITYGGGLGGFNLTTSLSTDGKTAQLKLNGPRNTPAEASTYGTAGQVMKLDNSGSFWTVADDKDSLAQVTCAAGTGYLYWSGSQWVCKSVTNYVATPNQGLVLTNGSQFGLKSCGVGEVLKYRTSPTPAGWFCASDNNTGNTYTAGTGLILNSANKFSALTDSALWNANRIRGKTIDATLVNLVPTDNGKVLTFDGTNWTAKNPGSGADNWGTQSVVTAPYDPDVDTVDTAFNPVIGDGTGGKPLMVKNTVSLWDANRLQGAPLKTDKPSSGHQILRWFPDSGVTGEWGPGSVVSTLRADTTGGNGFGVTIKGTSGQTYPGPGLAFVNDVTVAINPPSKPTASTPIGTSGSAYMGWDAAGSQWKAYTLPTTGTVSNVGLALPSSVFTVSNSPVTTSGTLTGAFRDQNANTVLAAPSGSSGQPSFRTLTANDIPTTEKGSLVQGTGVTLTGSLANRLIGAGDVTIAASQGTGAATHFAFWDDNNGALSPGVESKTLSSTPLIQVRNTPDSNGEAYSDQRVVLTGDLVLAGAARIFTQRDIVAGSARVGQQYSPLLGYTDATGARFQNKALSSDTDKNYALLQSNAGETSLNSSAGQNLHLKLGDVEQVTVSSGKVIVQGSIFTSGIVTPGGYDAGAHSILSDKTVTIGNTQTGTLNVGFTSTPAATPSVDVRGTMTIDEIQLRDVNPSTAGLQSALVSSLYKVCDSGSFVTGISTSGSTIGQPICTKLQ